MGAVAGVVGIESGVVSGVINLESSGVEAPDWRHPETDTAIHLFDNWIDPIETAIRGRIRGFIEELIHQELDAVLARRRYGRPAKRGGDAAGAAGHHHGDGRLHVP